MKHTHLNLKKMAISLALVGMLGAQTSVYSRAVVPGPDISVTSSSIIVNAPSGDTLIKVVIRVALPDGVEERISDNGLVEFDASGLPDGKYQYEAWALMSNADGKYTTDNSRGSIIVQGGSIIQKPLKRGGGEQESALDIIIDDTKNLLVSASSVVLDFVIPSAHAANLIASDATPFIEFNDTTAEGSDSDGREWLIRARDENFMIIDDSNDFGSSLDPTESNFTEVFIIEALGTYTSHTKIDTAPTTNSLVIKDTGDISLADSTMYISKASGKMGLGTITPEQGIHSKYSGGIGGFIRLEDTANSTWDIGQFNDLFSPGSTDGDFAIAITSNGNGGTTGTMLSIKDENGNVGIGTASPQTALHVKKAGAVMTVEDTNAAPAIRNVISLKNKGPVGFKMEDTSTSDEWAFRSGGGGSFLVSKTGVSGPLLSLSQTGSVSMGLNPGSGSTASNMVLSASGNMTIKGSFITPMTTYPDYVFNDDYKLLSLDELQEFVEKEKHLPNVLSEADVKKTKTVNVSKQQMTQLEKIEELTLYTLQQHQQIKVLNDRLESQNNSFQERLASLEKLVTNLASSGNALTKQGDKVAQK